jgi:prepilin-type N-terminal cleavage/methylation domain-containing protein
MKNMKNMVEEIGKIKKIGNINNNKKIKTGAQKFRIFKKGFSLAEMMVVMFILSLVLAAGMPIVTKKVAQDGNLAASVKALTDRVAALESGSGSAKCDTNQVKILDLCVAKTDISASSNWDNANSLCWAQGMRLPTQEEWKIIYYYKDTIGNFSAAYYWSATLQGSNDDYGNAWYQYFRSGAQNYNNNIGNPVRVRCVRSL